VRALLVASLLAGAALIGSSSASASEWYGWRFLGTTCVNRSGMEFAHLRVGMRVANEDVGSHYAANMRIKARLIHPGAGLTFDRGWRTQRYPVYSELLINKGYARVMSVNTDSVSPTQDWQLDIKLIWDRSAPWADVVKHYTVPFHGCADPGYNPTVASVRPTQ
jgi:hypothetical protein